MLAPAMHLLLLALLTADPRTVEVFKDKGDYFLRAGTNRGLRVGIEVMILGERIGDTDEYRAGGKATVLEVWESLARVSPDEEAKRQKEIKFARVPGPPALSVPPPPPASAPLPARGPVASATNAPQLPRPMLRGRAEVNGIGHLRRFTIFNDSNFNWTSCELRLANNLHFWLGSLRAGEWDGVMMTRFTQDGTEHDRDLEWIWVRCAEGESRFAFSL